VRRPEQRAPCVIVARVCAVLTQRLFGLHRECVARVELLKQQAAEKRLAKLAQVQADARQPTAPARDDSDSDSEPPDSSLFDWRAKRV
jgi:hypothetical protein